MPEVLIVRPAAPSDVRGLVALSRAVYGKPGSWKEPELLLHQEIFPRGQLVAVDPETERVIGMAVSLVLDSSLWAPDAPWREVTDRGRLRTHDLSGDLL